MNYTAYWFTNNGTRNKEAYKGTNKAQLIRDTREAAEGNTPEGGTCTWRVEDTNQRTVAAGGMKRNGTRWRANKDELRYF